MMALGRFSELIVNHVGNNVHFCHGKHKVLKTES